MERPFREHHLLELLEGYDVERGPIDRFIGTYFRANRALGSKDRKFIAETIYAMVRWQILLDHISGESSWQSRYETFNATDLQEIQKDSSLPPHIRVSFPKVLFDLLVEAYGEEETCYLCLENNEPAPTTVRANTLKTSRDELLKRWEGEYEVRPCEVSPVGIVFEKKIHFFTLPEFSQGFFEVQDEGSQLVAFHVKAEPGQQVMDFCSGSGGKALAFAPAMKGSGQIYLHDIRARTLQEAKVRLARAGIQNAQMLLSGKPALKKIKKKMDWILVDAPCSGTGTLRRNPDMKWRFSKEMVDRLVGQQRTIFEQALSFLKPGGKIVYATCSILPQENKQQVDHFLKTYNLELVDEPFQSLPKKGGMDGFFAATMQQK